MTQPTQIAFLHYGMDIESIQIYLKTLIISTSRRGHIIENIFLKVHRGESVQNFNILVCGKKDNLSRGSGIYVDQGGVVYNHHFMLPKDCENYKFSSGNYIIEIYASILGEKKDFLLRALELVLSSDYVKNMKEGKNIFFDWTPNTKTYSTSVHEAPSISKKEKISENLEIMQKYIQTA